MGKRPRIDHKKRTEGAIKVYDEFEYRSNKSSSRARIIGEFTDELLLSVWFDQHYVNRNQLGDDNGPRDGIDHSTIKALVIGSFKHLLYYGTRLETFKFLNHENEDGKKRRVVLQDSTNANPQLNVIIEVHFIDFNKYEITVTTAMCKDGFMPFDGDFALELSGHGASILKRNIRSQLKEIHACQI